MTSYDFRTLNDKDFEAIAADLLSLVEGRRIERFKPGKDQGVDGRFFAPDTGETIIQCKHWINSGYKSLLSHLKERELPKIKKLNCLRYILVASVPLSRAQKAELTQLLAPFVRSESDIFGPQDLNDLLTKHPEVESRHYRLWLSSVVPLIQVFSHAIVGRSQAELEEIREVAPLFVETRDFRVARQRLEKDHVLILTGSPGIGKTTLARQLALDHVAQGFKFITIEENLSEAEAAFSENDRQFFYFDDFLGRTYLEALSAKNDSHVAGFIKRIARSADKRLVLTSRTGILNQGLALSDLFAELFTKQRPYELQVEHLTKLDRARILYSHIWHSDLGTEHIEELYKDKRYHGVIQHKNYNPRLISFIVDDARVGDIPPSEYWAFVQRTLDRPDDLWDHVIRNQLDQSGRDLLFITVLQRQRISEAQLRTAFGLVPARVSQHAGQVEHDFRRAVKDATGSVLQRNIDQLSHFVSFDVFNPSLADYAERILSEGDLWGYYLPCLRSRAALEQLEQLHRQGRLTAPQFRLALRQVVEAEISRGSPADSFTWALARVLIQWTCESKSEVSFLQSCLSSIPEGSEMDIEDYLGILAHCEPHASSMLPAWFDELLESVVESQALPLQEPSTVNTALSVLNRLGKVQSAAYLRQEILESYEASARDVVREDGILSEFNPDETDTAEYELGRYFERQLKELGIEPTEQEVDRLLSKIDAGDIITENMAREYRSDEQFEEYRERQLSEREQWAAIDELFDRS